MERLNKQTNILLNIKNKLHSLKLEDILCIYIVLCPILDILSFLFRNYFETNISVSTFLRPIFPIIISIYIFIKANKKNKLILISIVGIYVIYGIIHLLVTNTFLTGCSYGGIKEELQYVINYSFLIVNLIIFYYAFTNKKWRKENIIDENKENVEKRTQKIRIAILIMSSIYVLSILLAIITKTSSYTYMEEKIGYKGWIESGNSLSAILCISLFIIYPLVKDKKLRVFTIITIILIGIYLVTLIGTRTGLIGFFLVTSLFITVEVILSKNRAAIIGFFALAVIIIAVGLVGSNTLIRREQINNENYKIIDEKTGEVGHMTGDMLRIKNKILDGTLDKEYMSEAQKQAVLDLNEYANKVNLAGTDTRTQQLMYNIYLVKEQKSILGIIFGNGYESNFREMVMENELVSFLLNFGIIGFLIYVGPFIFILIYSCIKIIKALKKKEKLKSEYILACLALVLAFALSYLSGYIFFNSSLMIILSAIGTYIFVNSDRKS